MLSVVELYFFAHSMGKADGAVDNAIIASDKPENTENHEQMPNLHVRAFSTIQGDSSREMR